MVHSPSSKQLPGIQREFLNFYWQQLLLCRLVNSKMKLPIIFFPVIFIGVLIYVTFNFCNFLHHHHSTCSCNRFMLVRSNSAAASSWFLFSTASSSIVSLTSVLRSIRTDAHYRYFSIAGVSSLATGFSSPKKCFITLSWTAFL